VRDRHKSIAFDQPLLQFLYVGVDHFHELPTRCAYKVVVVVMAVPVFVSCGAVLEVYLGAQLAFGQKFDGTVHGGISDSGIFRLYRGPQLVDGDVPFDTEKHTQYLFSGFAVLKALADDELFENGIFFHGASLMMKMNIIINYN
jgi:hypothetical protein